MEFRGTELSVWEKAACKVVPHRRKTAVFLIYTNPRYAKKYML